jgi:hypothetical protein
MSLEMGPSLSRAFGATAVLLVAAALPAGTQSPQPAQTNPPAPAANSYPAPTNLQVLPKQMTGAEVRGVMQQWKSQLNMDCSACHAFDKEKADSQGRPVLNFSDDSRPEKLAAREMFKMVEEINTKYIAKIDAGCAPVTCGTCHRGRVAPEIYGASSDTTATSVQ